MGRMKSEAVVLELCLIVLLVVLGLKFLLG